MHGKIRIRDSFWILLAALWCVDETNVLPLFLLAALTHELGHLLVLFLAGGQFRGLTLTCCGAVLVCVLPEGRYAKTAVCLAGPAASFVLTFLSELAGCWRLAGASALLGLFNLLPLPPLDGGMALFHFADGRFLLLRKSLSVITILLLNGGGFWLAVHGGGCWLLLLGSILTVLSIQNGTI